MENAADDTNFDDADNGANGSRPLQIHALFTRHLRSHQLAARHVLLAKPSASTTESSGA